MKKITLEQLNEAIQSTATKIEAAKKLGIARSTLYKLINEFNEQTILPMNAVVEMLKTTGKPRSKEQLRSTLIKSVNYEPIINIIGEKSSLKYKDEYKEKLVKSDCDLSKFKNTLSDFEKLKEKNKSRSHFIISDMQVTPNSLPAVKKTLLKIARKVLEKKPDVLIFLGDFADMESLFRASKKYDQFDSKQYKNDISASNEAMEYFQDLIKNLKVEQHITVGNHEDRINKFIENNKQISALISFDELNYHKFMTVHKYLEVATIDGIQYSHKFINGSGGADISSARALLKKTYGHACCGHSRKIDQFTDYKPNGEQLSTLVAGASYEHELDYLNNPQDRLYPRQVWFAQNVYQGFNVERFDLPSIK